MENRLKLRISRMFRSSFGSCRSKNITDVIERPVFLPQNRQRGGSQLIELFSPNPNLSKQSRSFPSVSVSVCRPKCPENFQTEQSYIAVKNNLFPRTTKSHRKSLLLADHTTEGQKCPPASPMSPAPINSEDQFPDFYHHSNPRKKKTTTSSTKKAKHKRTRLKSTKSRGFVHDQFPACSYNGLFSSDEDDDDMTTLFSSRSLSSDSSESFRRKKTQQRLRRRSAAGRNKSAEKMNSPTMSLEDIEEGPAGKVKDSFAVVKRSSNPYNDFRTSMVEMIIEKQIFAAKDLENLLQCFLSLNSDHHHRIIIQVYTEIWAALFYNNCS